MTHLRARRLLAGLPDGTLAPAVAAKVRAHAASCRACQRILAQHETLERLVRSLPASLLSRLPSPAADAALAQFARMASPRGGSWIERLPIHPVGAVATALALLLGVFLLTPPFEIETAEPFNAVVVARASRPARAEHPRRAAFVAEVMPRDHTAERVILIPIAMR